MPDIDHPTAVGGHPRRLFPGGATAFVLAVALLAGACSASSTRRAVAPPTRPDAGPVIASPTTKASPNQAKHKSEPYWVAVAALAGTGPTTTQPLSIDANALQWRITYDCQTAPFRAVALNDSGGALKRPLGDSAACGAEGKGFASEPGTYTLRIDTPGAWELKVEQQVDSPLIESLDPALAGAQPAMTATLYGVDRQGEGTANVYRLPDGSQVIRLEDFYVTINSDLELRLSPLSAPKTTDEIAAAPFVTVAPLKATVGAMNYPVPASIDVSAYHSIIIWCEITRNAYAAASLPES